MLHKIILRKIACSTFALLVNLIFAASSFPASPLVETRPATSVSETAGFLNARVISNGGSSIIERRFDWGTTPSGNGWTDWTASVSVVGDYFSYYLTGLNPGTTYYFRAWAKNSAGSWGKGNILSFTTDQPVSLPDPPTLVSPGTDSAPGTVVNTFTPTFTWNSVSNADYYGLHIRNTDTDTLIFDSEVHYGAIYNSPFALPSGYLQNGANYRWNMRSHNSAGWSSSFSEKLYFHTIQAPSPPTVVTNAATDFDTDSATLNGNLISLGTASSVNVSFEYGTSSGSYTVETPAQSMTITGAFSDSLSGLSPGTTYYFRAKAAGDGTDYGDEKSFTTETIVYQPPKFLTLPFTDAVIRLQQGWIYSWGESTTA